MILLKRTRDTATNTRTNSFLKQVNGTLVTSSNHVEVVRMIKSGSLVSLTLMGRPPGSGGDFESIGSCGYWLAKKKGSKSEQ